MIADPLTKAMNTDRLVHTMMSGELDLKATKESLMIKEKNRIARKIAKEKSEVDNGKARREREEDEKQRSEESDEKR